MLYLFPSLSLTNCNNVRVRACVRVLQLHLFGDKNEKTNGKKSALKRLILKQIPALCDMKCKEIFQNTKQNCLLSNEEQTQMLLSITQLFVKLLQAAAVEAAVCSNDSN